MPIVVISESLELPKNMNATISQKYKELLNKLILKEWKYNIA